MTDSRSESIAINGDYFAEEKSNLPEEWHETFDALTAQGKAPSSIKATIDYLTSEKTQKQVSREHNVSEVTIRNLQTAVIALGPLDPSDVSRGNSSHESALDYCNYIADWMGWEKGVHYNTSQTGEYSSPQPRLLARGWRSLFESIQGDNDES